MRRYRIWAAVACACLALGACAGPASPPSGPATSPGTSAAKIIEPAGKPTEAWGFEPKELRVASRTAVSWTNTGATFHTVTSDDAGRTFDSGVVNPTETFSATFAKPGNFPYHCDLHPWMKGSVQVCDGPCR